MSQGNELDPAFLHFKKKAAEMLRTETLETSGNDTLDFLGVHVGANCRPFGKGLPARPQRRTFRPRAGPQRDPTSPNSKYD